jgi:hypothetical protein
MKIYVIFGQRKGTYVGQYAPEALDVVDEYAMEENPKWLLTQLEEHKNNLDIIAADIFEVMMLKIVLLNVC